jgi:hypothetical protein
VGGEQLEELADSIAAEIRRGGASGVKASRIGDLAERGLARLDPVTAIQFASVYRRLSDLDELEAVVRKLREEPDPGVDQMPFEAIDLSDPKSSMSSPVSPAEPHEKVSEESP